MNKYVLCKGYYGMGGSLAVLVSAWRLAKSLNRELVVDWIDSVYGVSDKDIFQMLFETPHMSVSRDQLVDKSIWPEYWKGFVHRTMPHSSEFPLTRVTTEMAEEDKPDEADVLIITRDDKYWHKGQYKEEMSRIANELVPAEHLSQAIDLFTEKHLGQNCIAVHFRHGNGEPTVVPPDINWFFSQVDGFLKQTPESNIFVCTDCYAVIEAFKARYQDKVVYTEKEYPPIGTGAMHSTDGDADRLRSAEEAVLDIWLLSKCGYVIGSKSFFTGFALKLNAAIPRNNIKVWQPIHRQHRPKPNQKRLVKFPKIDAVFQDAQIPTDGLFVEFDDDKVGRLYYLYDLLSTFTVPSEIDLNQVKTKLAGSRLY